MKLEHSFARTEVTFGGDAAPTNAAYLTNDNVFNAPQYGVFSEPISSIAVAFDGPAGASDADVVFYLWDEESTTWFQFATETIPLDEIHFVPLPNIIDRKNTRHTSRISVAIVAGPSAGAPAGAYVVSSSSSTSQNSGSGNILLASIVALLTSIDTSTTSLDGKLENPMPVEGATAVGAVPASDPMDLGSTIQDADPAAGVDGQIGRTRLDSVRRLIVNVGAIASGVVAVIQGVDADDDPATANPLLIGGVHLADPAADTIDDGDVGYALLNDQRMQVVENRAYDSASAADRNIPVWNPTDLWESEDISDSATSDETVTKYVTMEPNSRWSLQFIPTVVDGETITLTVAQTNEDTGDVTTNTYTETSTIFFGVAGFTTEDWVEPEHPTSCMVLRVQVTVSGYSSGTPSWSLFAYKRGNS